MSFSTRTKKRARELHSLARQRGHTVLSFMMVHRAYLKNGHDNESFIRNMEARALYSDLCTLDDIDIVNENKQLGVIIDAR